MSRLLVAALVSVASLAACPATAEQLGPTRFDSWLSYQRNTDGSGQWLYQQRFYVPFDLPRGWIFTQRVDLPVSYTNKVGTDNPTGAWKAGIGDWFVEEIVDTPELAENFKAWASLRLVFPTGGAGPFGSGQYQWAPALSASYALPDHGITFAPVARYFMSFHATQPGAAQIRQLDLYPITSFAQPDGWSLVFYPENGITYNAETHQWFVPIDLMLLKKVGKTVEFGLGGAFPLVKDDPRYKYILYGRATVNF
jgi:hypothetical protein